MIIRYAPPPTAANLNHSLQDDMSAAAHSAQAQFDHMAHSAAKYEPEHALTQHVETPLTHHFLLSMLAAVRG